MTVEELNLIMREWELNAAELAKVLCLHTNRLSEYLGDIEQIPCSVAFGIDALQRLSEKDRQALFKERINRRAHSMSLISLVIRAVV